METTRLKLRQWNESDFAGFARYCADKDDARYVGGQKNPDQAWRHTALQIGHWKMTMTSPGSLCRALARLIVGARRPKQDAAPLHPGLLCRQPQAVPIRHAPSAATRK
jgi:hypothetical protein